MTRCTVALVVFASVLSLGSVGGLVACGGNHAAPESPAALAAPAAPDAGAAATPAKGAVKEAGDAKVGDTAKCPVSGEEFTVEASSPKVEHDGKAYYFCCGGCKKKFEADPSKYMKKS